MTILIVLLLIVVGYASCIATSIAGCIARIVKDVRYYIFPIMAYRTLIPMAILIVLLLIAVSYRSCITTGVAGRVA